MSKTLDFDIPTRERLREAYTQAVKRNADSFTFEGNVFVTDYAKYLLEFLDIKLGVQHDGS